MISVHASSSEREVVAEFFELFKTPWHVHENAVPCDVLLVSGALPDAFSAGLVIVYEGGGTQSTDPSAQPPALSPRTRNVAWSGGAIPLYQPTSVPAAPHGNVLLCDSDGQAIGLVVMHGDTVILRLGFNLFDEVRFLLSIGQPAHHAPIPTLDRHIALLRSIITSFGFPVVEIPPVPPGHEFAVCLTHDVDHPSFRLHRFDHTTIGFLYRATFETALRLATGRTTLKQAFLNWWSAFKTPFVIAGWARDIWDQFDRYLEIERGLGATYYFIPRKNEPGRTENGSAPARRGAAYGLSDVSLIIRRLRLAGCEIGVHGVDAWIDSSSGVEERTRISSAMDRPPAGIRMHWLYYNGQSPHALEAAGFGYDSTFGYNGAIGFRAGTLQAFKPAGATNLLELPLHIMDTALFYPAHLNLTFTAARSSVAAVVRNAKTHGGALTINWHDRSIAPERQWDDFYRELLHDLKSHGAWFPTAETAVAWFRKRRSATFEVCRSDNGARLVVTTAANEDSTLPGLRLRVYEPTGTLGCHTTIQEPGMPSSDIAFEQTVEAVLDPLHVRSGENTRARTFA